MIYTAEDDDIANDSASLGFEDESLYKNPNALTSIIARIVTPTRDENSPVGWQRNLASSRLSNASDTLSGSVSLPTTPTGVTQSINEREAAFLARVCKPDEVSRQAIAFSRQLLLPHLNSYPVHRRISLLTDITSGCKDFYRLEHELPFAILETVNDAFDSTSVAALSPSLSLLSQALRYNTKAFALSGAFPLLGLTLAKLFLIFKDAKLFEQLVEISDIVVKRWILVDMKDKLMPFLQSFIAACGRFWPSQLPPTAQQLMRTLIESCHSIVSVQALFDCARGEVCVGDDATFAILGAMSTVQHLLVEMANKSGVNSPVAEKSSIVDKSDTVSYRRQLIRESALPLVSNLITNGEDYCRYPKIFIEVTELLTVVVNTQCATLKPGDHYNDFWTVLLHCIKTLDLAILDLGATATSPALRTSVNSVPTPVHTEPTSKYNTLLLAVMSRLDEGSPYFVTLYQIMATSHAPSALRSLDVIARLNSYFCEFHLVAPTSDNPLIFVEIKRFLSTFYLRESRQSVRECILTGLSRAFTAKPQLVSEMVVAVVMETVFTSSANFKARPLISDTSSSKSAQAALAFIKQLFHATRPARNRYFFITQALNVFFTASNGGSAPLIEAMSREIFGIIVANTVDSLTCTGPVLMRTVETFGIELSRRFEVATSALETLASWRHTLIRFLCLCSALDTNSLGHAIADRRFIESACTFTKLEGLLELLESSSNLVLNSDRKDMVLIPGLKWSAELSVPVVALRLLALSLKHEKDPVAFKCLATITARFFSKRRVVQKFSSPALLELVNELIELLCRCAATSIKRHMTDQNQLSSRQSQKGESVNSLTSSPQVPTQQSAQPQPSPYCLHTIFRTFLLIPPLDFAIDEDRRCLFFNCLLKAVKQSPVSGDAMDCLTLCLAHMPTKQSQEWLERVTVDLSKLVSLPSFAPNVMLLADTLRIFIKRSAIAINQSTYLAIFSLVLPFANPCRFGFVYSSLAFNSVFGWFLDSPVHLRHDLGAYVLKQLEAYRAVTESSCSPDGVAYYDEMTELMRDVVTEHNARRSNDFHPSRLTEFEGAPTWFLDNYRIVSFKKDADCNSGSVSVLVRSPSSVSIFSLQRATRHSKTPPTDEECDSFENDACALISTFFGSSAALSLRKPETREADRGLKNFDLILPFQKFKVGILFCGPGQTAENVILSNCYGTPRYERFVERLGEVSRLVASSAQKTSDEQFLYCGGLDSKGEDGPVSMTYVDDYCQVAYHVATLMPNYVNDPKRNRKKRHIGNDYVIIIYNASGSTTQQRDGVASVISGSFGLATIVITPLLDGNNLVQLFGKHDVPRQLHWNSMKAMTVPESLLPNFIRLLAMHSEITAKIVSVGHDAAFSWLERLRHVRRLRNKLSQMNSSVDEVGANSEVVYQ